MMILYKLSLSNVYADKRTTVNDQNLIINCSNFIIRLQVCLFTLFYNIIIENMIISINQYILHTICCQDIN